MYLLLINKDISQNMFNLKLVIHREIRSPLNCQKDKNWEDYKFKKNNIEWLKIFIKLNKSNKKLIKTLTNIITINNIDLKFFDSFHMFRKIDFIKKNPNCPKTVGRFHKTRFWAFATFLSGRIFFIIIIL